MTVEKMKMYYENGSWSKTWLVKAVIKGKITQEQYKEITGEDYSNEDPTA